MMLDALSQTQARIKHETNALDIATPTPDGGSVGLQAHEKSLPNRNGFSRGS